MTSQGDFFKRKLLIKKFSSKSVTTAARWGILTSPFPKVSKGQMTAQHKKLPKQPVPPLRPTLENYLKGVRPLLAQDEFERTNKIVKDFVSSGGIGEKLRSVLMDRYYQLDNWIEDWWLELDFLSGRLPLITYVNPVVAISCENFTSREDYIRFSAKVIASVIEYKKLVDDHQLEPDMLNGDIPMDMSQYFKVFSSCRLPGKTCDRLVYYGNDERLPRHIIVVRNNRFFRLDVFDDEGVSLSQNDIFQQLRLIVLQSEVEAPPVGILTTNYREIWASVYERLRQDQTNRESMDVIQRALFVFSLDKAIPDFDNEKKKWTQCLHNALHGFGNRVNSGNRWIDKSFHLMVSENGAFGLNMEHSPAEVHCHMRMCNYIMENLKKSEDIPLKFTSKNISEPIEIHFNLNKQIYDDIEKAKLNATKCCEDADLVSLTIPNYGSRYLKSQDISADSFIQMAMQLAFYRLHGLRGVMYEVATLHKFLFGRMEIVHSTSTESVNFCKIMMNNDSTVLERRMALEKALKVHKHDVNECLNGNGMDCLLLGLKKAAIETGMGVPEIFNDIGFRSFFNYRLVTTKVPMKDYRFPYHSSFGPLTSDGYGCPYFVYSDHLTFDCLSNKYNPESNSESFVKCLEKSLLEMENVLKNSS